MLTADKRLSVNALLQYTEPLVIYRPWRVEKPPPKPVVTSESPRPSMAAYLRDYCAKTTIHGLRFFVEKDIRLSERLLWAVLWLLAVAGTAVMVADLAARYRNSITMTVIETTNFPVSEVPFPAVVICDSNRVHWNKALEFQEKYLKHVDQAGQRLFQRLLTSMASMEFADFDEFNETDLNDPALSQLLDLDLSVLMLYVMPRCEELFYGDCWWRNRYRNCCDIFDLQLTDIGFCFAFNSLIANGSKSTGVHGEQRPRRTSNSGHWSGLRVTVNSSSQSPPGMFVKKGFAIAVNAPSTYPFYGVHVSSDRDVQLKIVPSVTYTGDGVRGLPPNKRNCLYYDEGDALELGEYRYANCRMHCFRQYVIQLCGCVPYFFPVPENHNSCTVMDLKCLYKNNDVFNYVKPPSGNIFFNESLLGMECTCYADCTYRFYSSEMYTSDYLNSEAKGLTQLDVHFKQEMLTRYRTDVVFDWLTLMVSFGGTAGLFLGASLLSGVELLYYCSFRLLFYWKEVRTKTSPSPPRSVWLP